MCDVLLFFVFLIFVFSKVWNAIKNKKDAYDSYFNLALTLQLLGDNEESKKVYCNEINTIPGSLAFYLWKEVGMDFESECEELIKNALNRYSKKQKKTYSFDTNILDGYAKN